MTKRNGWHKANWGNGNDAVRRFMQLIGFDTECVAGQLFTCRKCEIPMRAAEFKKLGLDPVVHDGRKRFHSIVIDATFIGILKKYKRATDRHDTLHAASGLQARLLTNRKAKDAVKMFLKLVRSCITRQRNRCATAGQAVQQDGGGDSTANNGHIVCSEYLHISLAEMKKHGARNTRSTAANISDGIATVRWYVDKITCICPRRADCGLGTGGDREVKCAQHRTKLARSRGRVEPSYALKSTFEYVDNPTGINEEQPNNTLRTGDGTREDDDLSSDDDERRSAEREGDQHWMRVRFGFYKNIEYQLQTVLDVIEFCLVEPMTLGFFPYLGHDIPPESDGHVASTPMGSGVTATNLNRSGPHGTGNSTAHPRHHGA